MVINKIVGRNFFKDPGLDKSIIGDGVSTMFASIIGGPPSTTYGENIGVLAITKIYSIYVIGGAAVIAIILGFVGKFTALVSSIPTLLWEVYRYYFSELLQQVVCECL